MAKLNFRDIISTNADDNQFMNNHDANYDYMKVGDKYYAKRKNAGNDEWFDISGNMEATNKLDQYLSNGGDDKHSLPVKQTPVKPKTQVKQSTSEVSSNNKPKTSVNNQGGNKGVQSNSQSVVKPKTNTTPVKPKTNVTQSGGKNPSKGEVVKKTSNNYEGKTLPAATVVAKRKYNLSTATPKQETNQNLLSYAPSTQRVEDWQQFVANLPNRTYIGTGKQQSKKNNAPKIAAARQAYNQAAQAELNKRYYKK